MSMNGVYVQDQTFAKSLEAKEVRDWYWAIALKRLWEQQGEWGGGRAAGDQPRRVGAEALSRLGGVLC